MTGTAAPAVPAALVDADAAVAAVRAALRPGDLFGDLFAERRAHAVYELLDGEPRTGRLRAEEGVGLRRVSGTATAYASTAGVEADLPALARAARDGGPAPAGRRGAPLALPLDEAVAVARAATEAGRREAGGSPVELMTRVVTGVQQVLVAREDGRVGTDVRRYAALHVHAVVRAGGKVRRARRSLGDVDLAGLRARSATLGVEAVRAALERVDARPAPSGRLPVVLGPGGPATLLHEACGHPLEADLAAQPGSAYHGRVGQRVAGPDVTLLDDARVPGAGALYALDDEGEPAGRATLVERGVLRGTLADRRYATGAPTGHGRRLGYAHPPLPRMASTFLTAGPRTPAEVLAATGTGIYVRSISGGDTDMGSGRFTLQVDEGHLVEGGRLTAPIRGGLLSGRGPEVLAGIDLVADDCAFHTQAYLCNKLDQFPLVVNVGQPTVRVDGLTVWGG